MKKKIKRILLVNYNNNNTMNVAKVLQDEGYKVRLLNIHPKRKIKREFGIRVFNYYYTVGNSWLHIINRSFFLLKTSKLFMRQNTDLIMYMDEKSYPVMKVVRIPLADKLPYIIFTDKELNIKHKKLFDRANAIILPNEKIIYKYKKYQGNSLAVINYGIEYTPHSKKEGKIAMKLKGVIDDNKQKVILTMSNDEGKTLALVAALGVIDDYKLVFLGDKTKLLERLIKAFNMTDRVTFYKPKEELDTIYSGADLYYTLDEYDRNTILAMLHGIEVVDFGVGTHITIAEIADVINNAKPKKVNYDHIDYTWETFKDEINLVIHDMVG